MPNCENRALAPAEDVFWFDRPDEGASGKPTEGLTLAAVSYTHLTLPTIYSV